jgi:acetoin utilization protein AcuB
VREILQNGKFRHLPVADEKNRLVGIVTDRDLRSASPSSVLPPDRLKACHSEFDQTPVSAIMSRAFFTLNPMSTLDDALILLDREKIGALPVVDQEQRVIGMFSMRDLMAAYRRLFGLGERGSAMIVVEHDGKRKPLSRIAKVLEEHNIRFTRLIRTEAEESMPERIYLRVNTYNISAVHQALGEAGFSVVLPEIPEFAG